MTQWNDERLKEFVKTINTDAINSMLKYRSYLYPRDILFLESELQRRKEDMTATFIKGADCWEGELADDKINLIISGLLVPNNSMSVRLAKEVKELRERLEIDHE